MSHPAWNDRGAQSPDGGFHQKRPAAAESGQEESVDLAQLWAALVDKKRTVFGIAIAVFLPVMALTLYSRMTFETAGRLYLGELQPAGGGGGGQLDIAGGDQSDLGSEIEILQSRSLVKRAILQSGANVNLRPADWESPRFWEWLLSGRDTEILDVATKELRAIDTSLGDDMFESASYRVRFTSSREYDLIEEDEVVAHGELGKPLKHDVLQLNLTVGTERGPSPGAEYELSISAMEDAIESALGHITASAAKSSGSAKVVNITYTDTSPYLASAFLRALMQAYLDERQTWKTENATAAEAFVTKQLAGMRESLDQTGEKLADYRSQTRVVVMDSEARAMVEQIGKYEEQRVAARLEVSALQDFQRALKDPNVPVEAYLIGEAKDSALHEMGTSLAKSQRTLIELRTRFQDSAPNLATEQQQVDAQLKMIRTYVSNRLNRAQEHLASLTRVIGEYERKLKTVPGAELGLQQLARESEVYSRLFSYLLEQQQQAAIVKASTVSKNRILDTPEPPRWETAPNLNLRLASAVLGLLLGAIFVLVRRMFSDRLQGSQEVRREIGALPVLASIPQLPQRPPSRGSAFVTWLEARLLDPVSPYAEAFRTLRTNFVYLSPEHSGQVVLWTSPNAGDGKTVSAFAFAAALASNGKRVLIIDADLRKPSHHELLDYENDQGLRSILAGQHPWRECITSVPYTGGTFYSIPAGRMAPTELLSSDRMSRFIAETRNQFDYVLIDAPCYPLVSDAGILATHADCVLSVFRIGHTSRKAAADHLEALARTAKPQAVVINGAAPGPSYGVDPSWGASLQRRVGKRVNRKTARYLKAAAALLCAGIAYCTVALLRAPDELAMSAPSEHDSSNAAGASPEAQAKPPRPVAQPQALPPTKAATPIEPAAAAAHALEALADKGNGDHDEAAIRPVAPAAATPAAAAPGKSVAQPRPAVQPKATAPAKPPAPGAPAKARPQAAAPLRSAPARPQPAANKAPARPAAAGKATSSPPPPAAERPVGESAPAEPLPINPY